MDIIQFILVVIIFACVVYGLGYVCDRFGMPAPIRWICGAVIITILLFYLLRVTGVYPIDLSKPVVR